MTGDAGFKDYSSNNTVSHARYEHLLNAKNLNVNVSVMGKTRGGSLNEKGEGKREAQNHNLTRE